MIAISTAFKEALIAISIGEKKAFEQLSSNCQHSENILPAIDTMLDKLGCDINGNDAYSLVIGPGSFTGLRIGIALIKGFLAGGGEKKLIAITTNELMAYTYIKKFKPKQNFCCVVDALSNLYYVCEFSCNGEKLGQERLIGLSDLEKINMIKVGLEEEKSPCENFVEPSAEDLFELSNKMFKENRLINAEKLAPLYLRKSQAEASLEAKLNK